MQRNTIRGALAVHADDEFYRAMTAARLEIDAYFPSQADLSAWACGTPGSAPDSAPYGFNHLVDGRLQRLPGPTWKIWRGTVRHASRIQSGTVAVAWEERTLIAMAQSNLRPSLIAGGLIWATDDWIRGRARVKTAITRLYARQADLLWCLSRPQVEATQAWLGTGAPPIRYLRFGIDASFFKFEPYPSQALVFSAGGDRDRDTRTLFEALERIHERLPDMPIVAQTSSELQPPRGVRRVARLSHQELRRMYAQASIVVIATRPNMHVSGMTVALEAQSVGRPVVITRSPGLDDYIAEDATGLIVSTGDAEALAAAVVRLAGDPGRAAAMGETGRANVERNHTSSQTMGMLKQWLEEAWFTKYAAGP